MIRFLVVTVGLHLSRTVADLPCLQAWVVSLDLHHKQSWVSNYIYFFIFFIKYLPWHLWTWKHHKVWLEQHKQEIVIIITWNRIWHLAGWTKRETANLEKRCHSGACQWSHLQNKKTWDITISHRWHTHRGNEKFQPTSHKMLSDFLYPWLKKKIPSWGYKHLQHLVCTDEWVANEERLGRDQVLNPDARGNDGGLTDITFDLSLNLCYIVHTSSQCL